MNNSLLSSVVLAFFALAAIPGAFAACSNGPVTDTNLIPSCENISVNLATLELTGTCSINSGAPLMSNINLNSCVGNTNGELTASIEFYISQRPRLCLGLVLDCYSPTSGTNFSSSCEDIGFSGITLSAVCPDDAGNYVNSSLNVGSKFTKCHSSPHHFRHFVTSLKFADLRDFDGNL
ncbi:hypothetical protein C8R44DRAFT_748677 [Mycena epipterygia]|nr:hypothetical protein C8R44DRAFT_748677 [Mycena epipterygia]